MRIVILSTLLLGCWAHDPNTDAQYVNVKSVKGGGGQFQYRGGDNLVRFYNNTQSGYGVRTNLTATVNRVGICYMEVPTASLARDPKHVPAGNGSRPDLSRIETCCAGYIRNIHNFHLCDPVCTSECVNALCTAPNTCTCFPDHVKNLAGYCVATCPIGCQNGHCAGGECLCREGFELDRDGKFCVPRCRGNCGGVGNCTAPNTCACQPGYHSTPEGSCRPGAGQPPHQTCGSCIGGDCVGSECRCRPGYLLYKGECQPLCNPSCAVNTRCVSPNVCSASSVITPNREPTYINQYPQYPYPNQPQNINNGQYPNQYPQNQNSTNHGQHPNQYPDSYPQNQNNSIHGQNPNQYPGQYHNQYPGSYPQNQNNTIHGQNPNQYPGQYPNQYPGQNPANINNTISINYPHPNGQGMYTYNQFSEQQNRTSHGEFTNTQYSNGGYPPQQSPIYAQYPNGQQYPQSNNTNALQPGQYPQQSGQYPQQPGQYPQQPGQYPQQPGQYPLQPGQYQPGQQHLYPDLPRNQYPYPNQANNRTDGQVFHQINYNPLENTTFNLQQGHGQEQYGPQGQYGQPQYVPLGPNGQAQTGPFYGQPGQAGSIGQFSEGQEHTLNWSEVAQCTQPCYNGNCVGTNRCECFPGYTMDQADPSGTRCLPHCPGGCHNGICSAPNTCVCMVGYHKDFSVKGRSMCVKRNRRSVEEKPVNVAELLVFEIPDY